MNGFADKGKYPLGTKLTLKASNLSRTIMSLNVDEEDLLTEMEEALTSSPFIPLENVQEVARNSPLQVPKRYVTCNIPFFVSQFNFFLNN